MMIHVVATKFVVVADLNFTYKTDLLLEKLLLQLKYFL